MTVEVLSKCMPFANKANLIRFAVPLTDAMERYDIVTPVRKAAFLAQIAHESGSLRYTREIASGAAYDTRVDLGNTPELDGDGQAYKGRGLIQITGRNNYRDVGRALGFDFIKEPGKLELPGPASFSAAWFWKVKGLNEIADKPDTWRGNRGRYKNLTAFEYITAVINGGQNGLEDRKRHWERCKKVLIA